MPRQRLRRTPSASRTGPPGEVGVALIVTMLATMVLSALGISLLITTTTETMIVTHYRDAVEALHASDAALERTLPEVAGVSDWSSLLASPDGIRSAAAASFGSGTMQLALADGTAVDLVKMTNRLNCPQVFPPPSGSCTAAQMDELTRDRPWGADNPRWRLFASGPLAALVPGPPADTRLQVAVWVSDDPSETDGDPARDGEAGLNPGAGIVQVRGEAFGAAGARRAVEATIGRAGASVRVLSWRQVR